MFILKTLFWLGVVILLLPTGWPGALAGLLVLPYAASVAPYLHFEARDLPGQARSSFALRKSRPNSTCPDVLSAGVAPSGVMRITSGVATTLGLVPTATASSPAQIALTACRRIGSSREVTTTPEAIRC